MASASAPISCLIAGGTSSSHESFTSRPTSTAEKTPASLFCSLMPLALCAFSPAKARSSTGMPWKSESWMGLPQMLTLSMLFFSTPRAVMTLFTVSIRILCATSVPTLMQNVRWSIMFAPGNGWHSVTAVDRILPVSRSTACPLVPLVPMSRDIPYLICFPPKKV